MRHNPSVESVTVTVDSRLRMQVGDGQAEDRLKGACTHSNPAYHKAKAMGFRWTREPSTIATWRQESATCISLPRGCTADVRAVLADRGIVVQFDDQRSEGDAQWAGQIPLHRVTLWDHQARVVEAIVDIEQGLVRAPTASGKTTAGIAAIAEVQLPTLVLVWNGGLAEQWIERLCDELGYAEQDVGLVGSGKARWRPVTVAMQQTLARSRVKLDEAKRRFGFLLCDEVQRFAAETFTQVVDGFPARYRIGLSADETRKDRKEFLIYDQFGRVIADIDQGELEAKSLVMPVLVRVVPTDFEAQWYIGQLESNGEVTPDFTRLLEEMVRDPARNALLERVIMEQAGCTMVLTHRREQAIDVRARMAAAGRDCGLLLGGAENASDFEETVHRMRSGALALGVGTYQAVGTGMDIKPVSRAVCSTPIHANRQFFGQVRGRLCRIAPGKTDAEMVCLWDAKVFGDIPLRNLRRWNARGRVLVWDFGTWVDVNAYLEKYNERR